MRQTKNWGHSHSSWLFSLNPRQLPLPLWLVLTLKAREETGSWVSSSVGARTRVSEVSVNPAHSYPLPGMTLTTALSQMTDIRSSMPLVPSGIAVKLSFPIAFCAVLNVQWALPETCRSPLRDGGNKSIVSCFVVSQQQGHEGHGSPLGTGGPWLTSILLCSLISMAPQSEAFHPTHLL